MNKMRYAMILIAMAAILIQTCALSAQTDMDDQADFFGFKKYKTTYLFFYEFQQTDQAGAGVQARIIKHIAQYFVKGFDALMEGDPSAAIVQFKKASRLVPEYFHTDFIIALAYEEKGDFQNAARYFQSYLEKLKKFREGQYRLTGPLIEKTVGFDILGYDEAVRLISDRMYAYGIDMRKVSSPRETSLFVLVILAAMAGAILYLVTRTARFKRFIYKSRARHSGREGIWVCQYCGRENSNINTVCNECKMPHQGGAR